VFLNSLNSDLSRNLSVSCRLCLGLHSCCTHSFDARRDGRHGKKRPAHVHAFNYKINFEFRLGQVMVLDSDRLKRFRPQSDGDRGREGGHRTHRAPRDEKSSDFVRSDAFGPMINAEPAVSEVAMFEQERATEVSSMSKTAKTTHTFWFGVFFSRLSRACLGKLNHRFSF
jgi:hypothetical protein